MESMLYFQTSSVSEPHTAPAELKEPSPRSPALSAMLPEPPLIPSLPLSATVCLYYTNTCRVSPRDMQFQ